ncbi:MAG: hypothetical protein ACO24O_09070 [Arenimonas sp.]
MANGLYTKGKEALLGSLDLSSHTIKAQLVDTADYTVNLSTHDNLDDVAVAARVGTAVALASKTLTNGVFDAADITFTAVTGDPSEAIIIYRDTGVESTSTLIAYIDTATGLPVTPTGVDINVAWNASGIFSI